MIEIRPALMFVAVVGCLALSVPMVAAASETRSAKSIGSPVKVPAEWSEDAPDFSAAPEVAPDMVAAEAASLPITELGNHVASIAGVRDGFAFAYVEGEGFVVAFAEQVPSDVASALTSAGNVRFIENVGYTDDALEATNSVVSEAIMATVPEAVSVGVGFQQSANLLQITVLLPEEAQDAEELERRIEATVAGIPTFGYALDLTVGVGKGEAVDFGIGQGQLNPTG